MLGSVSSPWLPGPRSPRCSAPRWDGSTIPTPLLGSGPAAAPLGTAEGQSPSPGHCCAGVALPGCSCLCQALGGSSGGWLCAHISSPSAVGGVGLHKPSPAAPLVSLCPPGPGAQVWLSPGPGATVPAPVQCCSLQQGQEDSRDRRTAMTGHRGYGSWAWS